MKKRKKIFLILYSGKKYIYNIFILKCRPYIRQNIEYIIFIFLIYIYIFFFNIPKYFFLKRLFFIFHKKI